MWAPLGGAPMKTGKRANGDVANCGGALCTGGACIAVGIGRQACGFQGADPRGG